MPPRLPGFLQPIGLISNKGADRWFCKRVKRTLFKISAANYTNPSLSRVRVSGSSRQAPTLGKAEYPPTG